MRETPVIFMMLGVVVTALAIVGIASYYGESDWTWIAQQIASFFLIIVTFGIAIFTLKGWLR